MQSSHVESIRFWYLQWLPSTYERPDQAKLSTVPDNMLGQAALKRKSTFGLNLLERDGFRISAEAVTIIERFFFSRIYLGV